MILSAFCKTAAARRAHRRVAAPGHAIVTRAAPTATPAKPVVPTPGEPTSE